MTAATRAHGIALPKICVNAHSGALMIAFALIAALVVALRVFYAFAYPTPWTDETDFIAQSFALYKHHTLYVSALNEARDVMWMPPGYMFALAGVFKLFGYSFDAARWFSAFCYLASFALVLRLIARHFIGKRFALALLLSLVAFASPWLLVIANVARMEAFYTLLFMLALSAVLARRAVLGLALVLAAGVVHFNAVFFIYPFALYFGFFLARKEWPDVKPSEWLALALALAIDLAYAGYALSHWVGFIFDMRMQFGFKSMGPLLGGPRDIAFALTVSALPLILLARRKAWSNRIALFAFGAGFIVLALNGDAMWYQFAFIPGSFLLSVDALTPDKTNAIPRRAQPLIAAVLMALSF